MDSLQLLEEIEKISSDMKSVEPTSFDARGVSSEYDYCHICGATSGAHMRGITENMLLRLKKQNIKALGTEGEEDGKWALIDFNSVIVHIFDLDYRKEVDIEKLLQSGNCKRVNA